MKIGIPAPNARLSAHFDDYEGFAILETDQRGEEVAGKSMYEAPQHKPGLLPHWLHEWGADVIIAGSMGQRAEQFFAQNNITVVVGARADATGQLVSAYLAGTLQGGENLCDH